jgi:vacuolar-type H+-ATPase catalytic subunit A/Vma1
LLAGSSAVCAVGPLAGEFGIPRTTAARVVWQCSAKYEVNGKKGCDNKHIDDGMLYQAFVDVFNALVENKDYFMEKW